LVEALRQQINTLTGQRFGNYEIELADDFSYTDPVDGSTSQQQGLRILLRGGSRIIYRLSGTGTEGATLRVYIEGHEPDPERQSEDPQIALGELISLAGRLAEIEHYTGRSNPDVVT
jgi:phosphoglucomutase